MILLFTYLGKDNNVIGTFIIYIIIVSISQKVNKVIFCFHKRICIHKLKVTIVHILQRVLYKNIFYIIVN